jgi:hypothetical protein
LDPQYYLVDVEKTPLTGFSDEQNASGHRKEAEAEPGENWANDLLA